MLKMNPNNSKSNSSLLQPMELSPMGNSKTNAAENDEDDVIIGRFRKISSAKSMAITNGNTKYDVPAESFPKMPKDELEDGLQFRNLDDAENAKLVNDDGNPVIKPASQTKVTKKTSFRDTDRPSRFKDKQTATRFEMAAHEDLDSAVQTEDEEDGAESGEDSDDPLTANCDTKYGRSLRHFTREALPRLDNYRNMMSLHAAPRPTLDELHNASLSPKPGQGTMEKDAESGDGTKATGIKFGWIQGVLVRCLLNIWGVMLFLRLSWVVAQAGVAQSMVLILTTSVVTSITALSMSAISTNGVIKGGGTYYMISRSLGPEFGGSIGLIFSMANAVACAMYVVGFCESLRDMLKSYCGTYIIDGDIQDARIVGSITILALTVIVVVGMEWEAKAQIVLLVILLVAIGDFIIGTIIGPKGDPDRAKGFVGYNMTILNENIYSDYRPFEGTEHNFFSVFAIFFPAATGILAGANISGDLKDPQHSIPKGTLLAIFITTLSYLLIALLTGWTVARQATGNLADFVNGTFLTSCATDNITDLLNGTVQCHYGLHNTFQVIELVSGFGPLIYAGCFAATLSSALASLVSAPKVFQALCKDKLYPGLEWFARGYGKNNEPVRGYILTFFIALAFILVGKLNSIAPLISNFFLAAYTLINFSTFHASLAKPVGWRPTFRWYNMWLSLFGAVLCVAVMFLISWITALLTFTAVLALYLIVAYRKPDVNWGSTTQAQIYKNALSGVQQLNRVTDHVKNYRPQVLVLTGFPGSRPALADFTFLLTKGLSLMLCGHIVQSQISNKSRNALNNVAYQWLNKRKLKAFYGLVDDVPFRQGANALIQAAGIGKLKPNILLMGFKSDWIKCTNEELTEYVEIMHKALDMHMALCILRVEGGLQVDGRGEGGRGATAGAHDDDGSLLEALQDIQHKDDSVLTTAYRESNESLQMSGAPLTSQASSTSDISTAGAGVGAGFVAGQVSCDPGAGKEQKTGAVESEAEKKQPPINKPAESAVSIGQAARRASSLSQSVSYFARKQSGTIDVWWLYDDGGLTLLLPYIISTRRNWSSCRLRVFTLANKKAEMEFEERNMASLLSKFRIDYSDLKIIPDVTKKPQEATLAYFHKLIARFRVPQNPDDPDSATITEADLLAAVDRTNRHLRLRELIREHSSQARLLAVTLPMPRRRAVTPPALYQAWLEAIAGGGEGPPMPPCLLVRGNQTSVLTFYS